MRIGRGQVDGGCESHESGSTPPIQGFGEIFATHGRHMRTWDNDDEERDTGKGHLF